MPICAGASSFCTETPNPMPCRAAFRSSAARSTVRGKPPADAPAERVAAAMLDGIRALGMGALPLTREAESLRQRVLFLRRLDAAGDWPDLSDAALLAALEEWLAPYLAGITRPAQLDRLELTALLRQRLSWEQQQALDRLAPTHLAVPSGSRVPIDYGARQGPVLAGGPPGAVPREGKPRRSPRGVA